MTQSTRFSIAWRSVVLAIGLSVSALAFAQDKVIFQVTDSDVARWNLVLNNVRNLQTAIGPDADIEIVAYGPGVALLKAGSPIAARITETVGNKVQVVACQNTMAGMKLTKGDMLQDIGYVPSGVVEVMRKQQQGYAYIRP
ncbi:MAG: DsrE family protein [Burkholderiaceae bacterium]